MLREFAKIYSTMVYSKAGRRLHALAEDARESGKFLEALEYTDQATLAYEKDNDLFGLAEIQSSRQSTFKHLYRTTGDKVFLILEKHAAEAAVEIARESGIKEAIGIPYHNLGKYYFEVEEYEKAAEAFKRAVENLTRYSNSGHGRQSVVADIKGHQYAAEYHAGDKTALDRALDALGELKNAEEPNSYFKSAWLSGAHLRITEMVAQDNPELAKKHLEEARRIIKGDERLILRKDQLEKLEKSL